MGDDDISYEEYYARRRLVELCIRIAKDYEYGEILDNDLLTRKEYEKIHDDNEPED